MATTGSTSRKRTHSFHTQTPVAVKVGREDKIFWLYPSILTANSKFFRAALSEDWRTSNACSIDCRDFNVETFNHYVNWCHCGDLDVIVKGTSIDPNDDRCIQQCHVLVELYILAEFLLDKTLRNAIMDKILELSATNGYRPGDGTIILAFFSLPESSKLRLYMIDDGLAGISEEWLKEGEDNLPREYLNALLFGWAKASMDKNVTYSKPMDVARCIYHEHDEDSPEGDNCDQSITEKSMPVKTSPGKPPFKKKRC